MDGGMHLLRASASARLRGVERRLSAPDVFRRRRSELRRRVVAVAAAVVLVLMAWALALPGAAWPLVPQRTETIRPVDLRPVRGTALAVAGDRLKVWSADAGTALQVRQGLRIDAASLEVLRYRAAGFPATLELVFVWRRADAPDVLHSVTLPPPGRGTRSFRLTEQPAWRGTVIELGLAQFPVPLLVDEAHPFQPFEIAALRLESASLTNAVRTFADQLFAPRPWTQRSINSLGRELGHGECMAILALVAPLLALAVWRVLSGPAFRRGNARRVASRVLIAAGALGWVISDVAWHAQLLHQNALTVAARSHGGDASADAASARSAMSAQAWLARYRPGAKIAVLASSSFLRTRLAYHLRPADVSPEHGARFLTGDAPAGAILAVHDSLAVSFDDGVLRWPEGRLDGLRDLGRHGSLRLFEMRH